MGSSVPLTPFYSDFATYEKCAIKMKLLAHENMVTDHGKVCCCLKYAFGKDTTVETCIYHVPMAGVRLFSPKYYFQRGGKHSKMSVGANFVRLYVLSGTPHICIPYKQAKTLPMLYDVVGQ